MTLQNTSLFIYPSTNSTDGETPDQEHPGPTQLSLGDRFHAWRERRSERDRGAVLVESAIVMTMMLVIFFGVIEFGTAIRNRHALGEAVRTGVRAASALSREDGYHTATAESVAASLRDSGVNALTLTIYQAHPTTGDPMNNDFENCTNCYKFTWDTVAEEFTQVNGYSWSYLNQAACGIGAANDYVGIYVTGHYDMVTTFWSDRIELDAKAVMRLEPVTHTAVCS